MGKKPAFKDVRFSHTDDVTKVWIRAAASSNSQIATKV